MTEINGKTVKTRIYMVTDESATDNKTQLVRATSPASALRHATLKRYTVRVAEKDDLVALLTADKPLVVQDATEQPAGSPAPEPAADPTASAPAQ